MKAARHTDDPVAVLARRLEALTKELPELQKRRALYATQDIYILHGQFEWRGLEAQVPRRVRKHEAEVDVHDMAFAVDEDVPVMPVLDLEEVRDEGVACDIQ